LSEVLGVVLAGGENRRYGGHKALEALGDKRIIDRVIDAVSAAVDDVTLVANDAELYGDIGLDVRPDLVRGLGVLGGIFTAVSWAAERSCRAALVAACDMPFLSSPLLRELTARAEPDAVTLPESRGPRGFEPLCAVYGVECRKELELALGRGDRSVVSALANVETRIMPLETVETYGDPDLLFLNVNRPEDRKRAEALLIAGFPEGRTGARG
jgi:molybdopterin-guanine dinucleotide biosynthesis protein A